LWDTLDVDIGDATFQEFIDFLKKKHGLTVASVAADKYLMYAGFNPGHKARLSQKVGFLPFSLSL